MRRNRGGRGRRAGSVVFLLCCLPVLAVGPREAEAEGFILYPTGGQLFFLGGDQEKPRNAPVAGVRLEYNYSREHILSIGLVYAYSKAGIRNSPSDAFLEQHFCFLGYRFGRNWNWWSLGSHVGAGAVVKNHTNVPMRDGGLRNDTTAQYAMQLGLHASFRPFSWLSVGPDFTYMTSTDMDKWIFGGASSHFFRVGGHVGIEF